jgi:hypothetical protein
MKTIWKFPLKLREYNEVEMPKGAEVLTAQVQGETICVWAGVDPEAPTEPRMFQISGTGTTMHEHQERKYIGTVQRGRYVFHVFEVLGDWRRLAGI